MLDKTIQDVKYDKQSPTCSFIIKLRQSLAKKTRFWACCSKRTVTNWSCIGRMFKILKNTNCSFIQIQNWNLNFCKDRTMHAHHFWCQYDELVSAWVRIHQLVNFYAYAHTTSHDLYTYKEFCVLDKTIQDVKYDKQFIKLRQTLAKILLTIFVCILTFSHIFQQIGLSQRPFDAQICKICAQKLHAFTMATA